LLSLILLSRRQCALVGADRPRAPGDGLFSTCPLYAILGVNTCPLGRRPSA